MLEARLHRLPSRNTGYVRCSRRCGSVTSKSLGVGEFARYRPLLAVLSLSLSLFFSPLSHFFAAFLHPPALLFSFSFLLCSSLLFFPSNFSSFSFLFFPSFSPFLLFNDQSFVSALLLPSCHTHVRTHARTYVPTYIHACTRIYTPAHLDTQISLSRSLSLSLTLSLSRVFSLTHTHAHVQYSVQIDASHFCHVSSDQNVSIV